MCSKYGEMSEQQNTNSFVFVPGHIPYLLSNANVVISLYKWI